jgi:hypothetical protein
MKDPTLIDLICGKDNIFWFIILPRLKLLYGVNCLRKLHVRTKIYESGRAAGSEDSAVAAVSGKMMMF